MEATVFYNQILQGHHTTFAVILFIGSKLVSPVNVQEGEIIKEQEY